MRKIRKVNELRDLFKGKIKPSPWPKEIIRKTLKVDKYGTVYIAELKEGEKPLSFEEVMAIARSRK